MPCRVSSSISANSACGSIDHAVADDAGDAGMQDAGRDEPQDELRAVDEHGVAGVVPALIARDDRKVRRQQVDDLCLCLRLPTARRERRDS